MGSYFRYHKASGHVDSKLVVEEDMLPAYEQEGFDFIETDLPFGNLYVDGNQIKEQTKLEMGGGRREAMPTERVTISGLPADAWVMIDNAPPVPVVDGAIVIDPQEDNQAMVQLVGKYRALSWLVFWTDLPAIKEKFKGRVDAAAEAARNRVVTLGSGQAMTYIRKADAARQYLAGLAISAPQMQRLSDEASRLGISIDEAAAAIVAVADQWETTDATIDSLRLTTKAQIDAAESGDAVGEILRNLVWPV